MTRAFNIKLDSEQQFIRCRIYKTEAEMQKAIRREVRPLPPAIHEIGAYSHTMPGCLPSKCLALIYFSEEFLGHGTISHEMIHVGSAIMGRFSKWKSMPFTAALASAAEEELAELSGNLVDEFYKKQRI